MHKCAEYLIFHAVDFGGGYRPGLQRLLHALTQRRLGLSELGRDRARRGQFAVLLIARRAVFRVNLRRKMLQFPLQHRALGVEASALMVKLVAGGFQLLLQEAHLQINTSSGSARGSQRITVVRVQV